MWEYGVSDVLIYRRLRELGIDADSNTTKIEKAVAGMMKEAGFKFVKTTDVHLVARKLTFSFQNTCWE